MDASHSEQSHILRLPPTLDECLEVFAPVGKAGKALPWKNNDAAARGVLKYCMTSLRTGRPFSKAMIFIAGETGAGKSSTINRLFNDETLCPTSNLKSMTKTVVEIEKELLVPDEAVGAYIKSSLVFVDIPGCHDIQAERETVNYDAIQRYLAESKQLTKRESKCFTKFCGKAEATKLAEIPEAALKDLRKFMNTVEEKVRPNLVLLCVKAGDNRMDGEDSSFVRTLKNLQSHDVVDTNHKNLIVVVTHALKIQPKKMYKELTTELKNLIQKWLNRIFGFNDFPIVFVENQPDKCDYVNMKNEFVVLPDGELSHLNLVDVMGDVFEKNGDFLGMMLCGWYFSDYCPDKNEFISIAEQSTVSADVVGDTATASKSTPISLSPDSLPMRYLGYGYSPSMKTRKNVVVSLKVKMKVVKISKKTFLVPDSVDIYNKKTNYFEQITGDSATKKILRLSFLYTVELFSAKIAEIKASVAPEILQKIKDLPSNYTETTEYEFTEFINKWGTHLVSGVSYGGAIEVNCALDFEKCTSETVECIHAQVKKQFESMFVSDSSAKATMSEDEKTSSCSIPQKLTLKIYGGIPPPVFTLHDLTPEMIHYWIASIEQNAVELKQSVQLYPYYDLVDGAQSESLRAATCKHESSHETSGRTREEIADSMKARTVMLGLIGVGVTVAAVTALAAAAGAFSTAGVIAVGFTVLSRVFSALLPR